MGDPEFAALFHPDDAPGVMAHMQAVTQAVDGQIMEIEYRFRTSKGNWVWYLSFDAVFARNPDGTVKQFIGTFIDINARKQTENQIKEALAEKEVLLKEIHHRVKNNMQVISSLVDLQAEEVKDPAMRGIFRDVVNRVRSMAMVHENLYQSTDLAQVDFADYARSLLGYLWRAQGTANGIRLDLELESVLLTVNAAVPCGLILNELFGNALKHAFVGRDSGKITVSLKKSPQGKACLGVRDDGTGMPPEIDCKNARSLGLRLVQMLARQLKATVEVASTKGTEFTIAFEVTRS
jgi:two-component sensor histidine kinase